jgi:hypothetical protein
MGRWNAKNLKTEGVMDIPTSNICFIAGDHPVVDRLRRAAASTNRADYYRAILTLFPNSDSAVIDSIRSGGAATGLLDSIPRVDTYYKADGSVFLEHCDELLLNGDPM